MKLWIKILIALVLGVVAGLFFGPQTVHIKFIGTIFLNLINMVIVLLVVSSMTVGVTSIHDPKKLGRVGGKSILLYLFTTLTSIGLGILFCQAVQLGRRAGASLFSSDDSH